MAEKSFKVTSLTAWKSADLPFYLKLATKSASLAMNWSSVVEMIAAAYSPSPMYDFAIFSSFYF